MKGQLIYLPPGGQRQAPPQVVQQQGADKYHGAVATGYDAKRENDPKWTIEQKIIEGLLDDLPEGSIILDAPVGTGRFLPCYARKKFKILGLDKSLDMLKEAHAKGVALDIEGDLIQGDVRETGFPDQSVDAVINCRITRWLSPEDCQKMFREMQRVSKDRIIWTARVANHPHARTLELFEDALQPGWSITDNIAGYTTDYRILVARRGAE